jgi:S-DNA-T family DNA segregation ATPase FtsK/SpoIIIE
MQLAHGRTVLPYRLLLIDESAAIATDHNTMRIEELAQQGRKAGIRLVISTQAPRAEFVSGPTRASIPARVCLKTTSALESRQVLDCSAPAHELQRPGEAYLVSKVTLGKLTRLSTFEADAELVRNVQGYWCKAV